LTALVLKELATHPYKIIVTMKPRVFTTQYVEKPTEDTVLDALVEELTRLDAKELRRRFIITVESEPIVDQDTEQHKDESNTSWVESWRRKAAEKQQKET